MRKWMAGLALMVCAAPCWGQLTTVQDTLYTADGRYCSGSVTLAWGTFVAPDGHTVYAGSWKYPIPATANNLSVTIEPGQYTATYAITPAGCSPAAENWIVPTSASPVNLLAVRSIVPPTPFAKISLGWIAQAGATTGQVMCWNGTTWAPGNCGAATVSSVFGRTGAITGQSGDYAGIYQPVISGAPGTWPSTWPWSALSGVPTFATVATSGLYSDLSGRPTLPANTTSTSHQFFSAYNSTTGAFTKVQPACGDLSNAAASCSSDATNASNINSGTLAAARGGAGTVSGPLKGNGSGVVSAAAASDIVGLFSACSGTQYLGADGACHNASSSTATTYANIFDGSATTLADGSTVSWTTSGCASNSECASWTVPAGVNAVRVVAWSGGGGGGGSSSGSGGGPAAGGGGYIDTVCAVTPGNSYTVEVGMGGSGGAANNQGTSGGASAFGTCFTLVGGSGPTSASFNFGGYLNGMPLYGWFSQTSGVVNTPSQTAFCNGGNTPGYNAGRPDQGGCGAADNTTSGSAGLAGGAAAFGGGGGGSGGYNSATGGAGGVSGIGGSGTCSSPSPGMGGCGGGWTSGGGLVVCTAGSIPGGGGGAAGITTAGSGNQSGCGGGRGEVRIYYSR